MNYSDEKRAKIFLNMVPQVGPRRFSALIHAFGSAQNACEASGQAIVQKTGLVRSIASEISGFLKNKKMRDDELDAIEKARARMVLIDEPEYPELLKHIDSPPPVLYVQGLPFAYEKNFVALVGTRRPTSVGRSAARSITEELVRYGIATVSGGARGIDTEVHTATCDRKGFTIAVMGCGLGIPYPRENKKLFERIGECGMCISEFPMNTMPDKRNFPQRNRIISGISTGTVVVEAPLKSGALITARFAAYQGRDVLAVPGHAFNRMAGGSHWLLRQGARPVVSGAEIMEDLFHITKKRNIQQTLELFTDGSLGDTEQTVVDTIGWEPTHIDRLLEMTKLDAGSLMQVLLTLQMKGIIEELPGKQFVCCAKGSKN